MAALDETGETRLMPALAASRPATPAAAAPAVRAQAAETAPPATARVQAPPAAAPGARAPVVEASPPAAARPQAQATEAALASSLTDTQVLKILEQRRADQGERGSEDANAGIALLKPDDTGTRRALKEAVRANAPVSFAVQLQWSVQPVQIETVPPLAIFSAYTLYTVEGSREGRKWYGLRLGFFSDAMSAKQVAHYVRSEFTSVAVVPVSSQERSRASDDDNKSSSPAFPKRPREQQVEEFKLFDAETPPTVPQRGPPPAASGAASQGGKPGGAGRRKTGGRVRAREERRPQTLEETLEILGAGQLEIDNGRGETLNDTGVRHLRVQIQKNTPFSKLLERLSERVRKP